jgi:ParB family chromosome partitioning protein
LLSLTPPLQKSIADTIVTGGLSVRQTETLVKRLTAEKKSPAANPFVENGVDYTAEAQKDLSSRLGRGVRIVNGRKKGRIELEYYGLDDLNDLLDALAMIRMQKKQKGSNDD